MKIGAKSVVFLLINGLADIPLKKSTPLSKARTPNLDGLAKKGITGELSLLPKNLPALDEYTDVSILGYDLRRYKFKRGVLDAIAMNIPFKSGDLAWSCCFASIDEKGNIIDRRASWNDYGLDDITRNINELVDVSVPDVFLRNFGHRAVLVFKGNFSEKVVGNDPMDVGKKPRVVKPIEDTRAANLSAVITNSFIEKAISIMQYHPKNLERMNKGLLPVNYLLVRGAGTTLPTLPSFKEKWGIKKCIVISEPSIAKAIGLIAGFDSLDYRPRNFDQDMDFVFSQIEDLLGQYDFIMAHVYHLDDISHRRNPKEKIEMIEKLDEKLEMFKDFNGILVITTNHITSCKTGRHEKGNVPFLIYGKGKDKVTKFDELSVKKGKLKNFNGSKLWKFIFQK